jgi:predicted regulator of Ras-like GTPase activity (Roadblock/LC7/MglB family)
LKNLTGDSQLKAENQNDRFQVAVDYLSEYSGVKIALVLDKEGLVVAQNSPSAIDGEDIAAVGLELLNATNKYAEKLAGPRCEMISLKTTDDWVIIADSGEFYLLILAERRVDDLLSVRVQRSVEMITNYVDKKYPELKTSETAKAPVAKKVEA